jgi:hypothetical protein
VALQCKRARAPPEPSAGKQAKKAEKRDDDDERGGGAKNDFLNIVCE